MQIRSSVHRCRQQMSTLTGRSPARKWWSESEKSSKFRDASMSRVSRQPFNVPWGGHTVWRHSSQARSTDRYQIQQMYEAFNFMHFCLVGFEAHATWPTFRLSSLWSGGVGSCWNVGGCETPSVRGICPMACPRAQSSCSGSVRTFWRWRSNLMCFFCSVCVVLYRTSRTFMRRTGHWIRLLTGRFYIDWEQQWMSPLHSCKGQFNLRIANAFFLRRLSEQCLWLCYKSHMDPLM